MTGTIARNHAALPDEAGRMLDDLRAVYAEGGHPDDPATVMAAAVKLLWLVSHGVVEVRETGDGPPQLESVH